MSVHSCAAPVEQDRPGAALADRVIQGSADGRWQWDEHGLVALAVHPQDAVAVFLAEVGDVRAGASKIRKPRRPSMATRAKSDWFGDWRAVLRMASNCRCPNPRVGDSVGTGGRRTCSVGDWASMVSRTQVR